MGGDLDGVDSEMYAYGEEAVRLYMQQWRKAFTRPKRVDDGGGGEWEWVRRE